MNFAPLLRDSTTVVGTGNVTTTGAAVGFQSLTAIGAVGSTFGYTIRKDGSVEWEEGVGTLLTATTFSRAPSASSNAGALVAFSAGTKDVILGPTASRARKMDSGTSANVVYLSSMGILSDADVSLGSTMLGTDQGAKIQAVLDMAVGRKTFGIVVDVAAGVLPQFSDVCLKVHDNTVLMLMPGCWLIKQGTGNESLLSNYDRTDGRAGISTNGVGNKNIAIIGDGSLNGAGTAFRDFQMFGVDGFVYDGPNLYNSAHFHAHLGNITNFSIKNIYIDKGTGGGIFGDGLHICGPAADGIVDNLITRNCGDDNFALNADDAWVGNTETYQPRGAIRRIRATNINMKSNLYGVRVLSGGSPVDDIYIGNVTGTTNGYAVVIDCFDPAQTLVSGPGAVGTITLADIDVDVSAGGDPNLKGCMSINLKIDQLNIIRYKRKFFLNTAYASMAFGARANIANLYVEAYSSSPLNGGTSLTNQFDFRSGSNIDTAIFASCNFKAPSAVTGSPIIVQSGATIGQLVGNGNGGINFTSFVQNNGTITYNHFTSANNYMDLAGADTTAPTINSASVEDAAPTVVVLYASEALDTAYVPAASAFTVSGHTVSSVAVSGSSIKLTVSAAFTNGEAARTVAYTQPGTNNARDLAGNLLANFSALPITNNVGAVNAWVLDAGYAEVSSSAVTFTGSRPAVSVARKSAPDTYSGNVQLTETFSVCGANDAFNVALLIRGSNLQPYSGSTKSAYVLDFNINAAKVTLQRSVGGTDTVISSPVTIAGGFAGGSYRLWATAKGTAISARVQRLSDNFYLQTNGTWAATAVDCVSGTDSGIASGTGLLYGVYTYAYSAAGNASTMQCTNFGIIAAP